MLDTMTFKSGRENFHSFHTFYAELGSTVRKVILAMDHASEHRLL